MRNNKLAVFVVTLSVFLFSCTKDDTPPVVPAVTTGVYVLNQGLYGNNNTSLTYYDFSTSAPTTDFFKNVNGFGLGDTGSDFIIYGSKTYVVVNVSGYVAVLNTATAKFTDTINFKKSGVNSGPQNIVASGKHVFVTATDGTVAVIDTVTLAIEKYITVGSNPAQMAVSGDNLYVSNTGGFSATYDSTVSVISLNSLTVTATITVGLNPGSIAADDAGNIYVACTGDYGSVAPKLVKVALSSSSIIKTAAIAIGTIRFSKGQLLTTGGYLGAANVGLLNTTDLTAARAAFITDGSTIVNPYGLDADPVTGDVYVGDAKDYVSSGEVFCFDKAGKKKFSFSTNPGISPIRTQLVIK